MLRPRVTHVNPEKLSISATLRVNNTAAYRVLSSLSVQLCIHLSLQILIVSSNWVNTKRNGHLLLLYSTTNSQLTSVFDKSTANPDLSRC